ncbi:MAG: DUF1853 family protein [Gammaproteobacteria bacterium]|nr:DUF1853 family protein [Gammaproteobacteria bacterium]MDP2141501.1 DUF1853 family protein [Gammaproteobacteria bacterium]MDP2347474.1 DUF1853 family protein [Gammaproteobacteria bacterium]
MIQFRNPAVRHLAWMCHVPQLLESALVFDPGAYLPTDVQTTLLRWDTDPQAGPSVLTEEANPRLGLYFERLYECLMTEIMGWQILAKNLQIRHQGITLGELDFVLRNPHTNAFEHHEIAVKFYLGYNQPGAGVTFWHGPNAVDRLDLKTHNLLEHQSQRTQLAATTDALLALGIAGPVTSRIFMPGYLFYPREPLLSHPEHVPANHLRGQWFYLDDALQMHTKHWVPLRKPHWLGGWVQEDCPDAQAAQATLAAIRETGTPRLFATVERGADGLWKEVDRFFVVPTCWPIGEDLS